MDQKTPQVQCTRCLLRDLGNEPLYERIRRTVDAIAPTARCPDDVYEARLLACGTCEKLFCGMCRICGCYVEVRAAKSENRCPKPGGGLW